MQVDVFYKGMVYEAITVQEAFPFLSLLGEVGAARGVQTSYSYIKQLIFLPYTIPGRKHAKDLTSMSINHTTQYLSHAHKSHLGVNVIA